MLPIFIFLFFVIVVAYVFAGERHIFFKQVRTGYKGKKFWMYKFRTLHPDTLMSLEARQFDLGRWLRRTNLDELPQIANILFGDMSWIGPRPMPVNYDSYLSPEQKKRWDAKPGITGWAQVNGRHSIEWKKKFELDAWYAEHLSFAIDVKIFVKTLVILLSLEEDKSLSEKEFKGQ